MITYNWNFNPLTCHTQHEGHENVVLTVHWQLHATQEHEERTYVANSIGTINLTIDSEADSFIPFAELTKDIVQSWVEASLGEERIQQMQQSLAAQIEEQITPKIVNLVAPWEPNNTIHIE